MSDGTSPGGYDILADRECLYCGGREFPAPEELQEHVAEEHPGTYADVAIQEARG